MENIPNDFTFFATTIEEANKMLNSDTEKGLSHTEAKERLNHFGLNAIEEATKLVHLKFY